MGVDSPIPEIVTASAAAGVLVWRRIVVPTMKLLARVNEMAEYYDRHRGRPDATTEALATVMDSVAMIARRQRAYLMESRVAMAEFDAAGLLNFANRACLTLLDRSAEDAAGTGWLASVHYSDRESLSAEWAAAIAGKRSLDFSFALAADAGKVDCRMAPMLGARGEAPIGWFGFFNRA